LVLLLAMTPVVAVYTYWSAQWSSRNYIVDLKRETRATSRALAPVVADYIQQGQWRQVHELLQRMSADDTEGAVLRSNGELWYAVSELPHGLIITAAHAAHEGDGFDFEESVGDRYWLCHIVPLNSGKLVGYLLVAQDWTDIDEDVRQRMLPPIGAALLVTALVGALIPILVDRYVSQPLAELSRRVLRFSDDEGGVTNSAHNEVELLSEEFRRLDRRLTKAHEDLLERHRYELELDRRLQRADRLATIGTLASGLAHEIGTPMGVIRTRAELLLEGNLNPERSREGLEIILSQIERITRIVRMLLDYARSREPVRTRHDVQTIIQHALKLLETEAKRRSVGILLEPSNEPLTVECDPEQLQQVFINLSVNALDAMAPSGGTLRVSMEVEQREHHSAAVKLTFEDNGPGVPLQFQEHLFDPFFTTKPPGQGTGMGLAVSQAIIHDHNGEISFDSRPNSTCFYVRIPMAYGSAALYVNGDTPLEHIT
jgi:two-component system, NtrC family, sensor kinase